MTRHAVLGPGGIGGLVGGALARTGASVTLVPRPGAALSHPKTLEVESAVLGTFRVSVEVSAALDDPVDVLWVTVKAHQLEAALGAVVLTALDGALVVALLNGIDHVARLRSAFPLATVVAGSIRTESTRVAPGHIAHAGWHVVPTAPDGREAPMPKPTKPVQLAGVGAARGRVIGLAESLEAAGIPCQVWADEGYVLWNKLAILCPYALATTAAAGPIGAVRANPSLVGLLVDCAEEVLDVAQALGVELDRQEMRAVLDRFPDAMRVSMERDASSGRPIEIEAIAGPVIREGRARGVSVRATETLRARAVASAAELAARHTAGDLR